MKTVLFVCTGNTCRSPMAQALFNAKNPKPEQFTAVSAGLYTCDDLPASENAIQAMAEMGIDLSHHKSRILTEEIAAQADYIVCMTAVHYDRLIHAFPAYESKIFTIAPHDISDPFGGNLETYRACAQELSQAVAGVLQQLTGEKT